MKTKEVINNEDGGQVINRKIMIFISAFLAIVILFGAVFGALLADRHRNATVMYGDLTMDLEVTSFFLSYYKTLYMSELSEALNTHVPDSEWFWNSEYEDGKTYGNALSESAADYVKSILVKATLFDSYTELTDEGEQFVANLVDDFLSQRGFFSKESFNASVKEYGFSYNSFKKAVKLLYKANNAQALIYGTSGENVSDRADVCAEYLKTYSHVKLLFIRTENDFLLDEEGNRVKDENSKDVFRPLIESERVERQEVISTLRQGIVASENGEASQITDEYFDAQIEKYDSASEVFHKYGYYFHENSNYPAGFASDVSLDVAKKALSMKNGEYAEVELKDEDGSTYAICFIYKYEPQNGSYVISALDIIFDDFYSDCARYSFNKDVALLATDAVLKEKYFDINIITLPYNTEFVPRFN